MAQMTLYLQHNLKSRRESFPESLVKIRHHNMTSPRRDFHS